MGKTFGAAWDSPKMKGRMVNDDGFASDQFIEWSLGTAHLTDENWAYGFERVIMKMRADAANAKDPFPPQTPAIFCCMCFPPPVAERDKVKAAGHAALSYRPHPDIKPRDHQGNLIEPSPEHKEKKRKVGNSHLNSIKDLF